MVYEYENKPTHLCVMFPDGETHELPAESFELEPLYSDQCEMPNPDDFNGTMTATATLNPDVLALLLDAAHFVVYVRYRRIDMRMHHRRRFPWGRRFMSRKGRNGRMR